MIKKSVLFERSEFIDFLYNTRPLRFALGRFSQVTRRLVRLRFAPKEEMESSLATRKNNRVFSLLRQLRIVARSGSLHARLWECFAPVHEPLN
jgi:hypothetical protein